MSVSRFLSLVVFCIYIIIALFSYHGEESNGDSERDEFGRYLYAFMLWPLICLVFIWFPDKMGGLVMGRVTRTSPAGLVAFMGWVLLLLPGFMLLFTKIICKYVL